MNHRNNPDLEAEWERWRREHAITAAGVAARRRLLWYALEALVLVVGFSIFVLVWQ